eukprot:gene9988-7869_t
MDPMSLLMDMEQCHAGQDGVDQPFELIRSRRADYRASRRRQRAADEEDDDDGVGGTAGGGDDADADAGAPSMLERKPRGRPPLDGRGMKGRGSGRPRGRPSRRELEDRDGVGAGGRGVFGASVDEIWEDPLAAKLGMNPRAKRRKKRKGKRSQEIPEEVSKKLGEANLMYAMSRYREAIELLTEVIKEYPKITDPYHTLGLIHEATGYSRKALDFYMIAAHLAPRDMPLWKRLAALSTEVGLFRQAIYCLSRVIRRSKGDLDALWDRAVLYAEVNELERALAQFEEVGRQRVGDPEVPKMIARLQHRLGLRQQAIETLEKHLRGENTSRQAEAREPGRQQRAREPGGRQRRETRQAGEARQKPGRQAEASRNPGRQGRGERQPQAGRGERTSRQAEAREGRQSGQRERTRQAGRGENPAGRQEGGTRQAGRGERPGAGRGETNRQAGRWREHQEAAEARGPGRQAGLENRQWQAEAREQAGCQRREKPGGRKARGERTRQEADGERNQAGRKRERTRQAARGKNQASFRFV